MGSIKKKIKNMMPDRCMYMYSILQKLPAYVKACYVSRNEKYPSIKFYDDKETIEKIVNEGNSLSRFGDGEFMWMSGEGHASFQDYSKELGIALIKAFQSKNEKLLVGIPYGIFHSEKCNLYAKMHWKIIKSSFFSRLIEYADLNRTYCNASITRPYIDYHDMEYSKDCFDNLKKIWNNRDIVIVEGEKTKLGLGNDLFNNAKSIKRIICPAENAFEKRSIISQSIKKHVSKNYLILAALGPTASILAAELVEEEYQIVDIGHIDVEYMWFLNQSILREPIEGKYVNESGILNCSNKYDNEETYRKSIIDWIKS